MDSDKMDLSKVKNFIYSLDPQEYIDFMKDAHLHCPFRTKELTEEIIFTWQNDRSITSKEFNEIMEQRGKERIEEIRAKRRGDLQRIKDNMTSKTGLLPLELFPEEIWKMLIIAPLPEEKRTFWQVHESFCDFMQWPLFADILLPMIIGFKVERFWGEADDDEDKVPKKPVFCALAQYVELRLVSKSVRDAVDRWFKEDIMSRMNSGIKKTVPAGVVTLNLLDVDDSRWCRGLKENCTNADKPLGFFTRSLALESKVEEGKSHYYDSDDSMGSRGRYGGLDRRWAKYTEDINEILDHVGDQIWYFSFEFESTYFAGDLNPVDFPERYAVLLGWLEKMPNLKWLRICVSPIEKDYRSDYQIPDGLVPPTLNHLERMDLELQDDCKYLMPVYYNFLSANPHVKILNLLGLKYVLHEKNGFIGFGTDARTPLVSLEVLNFNGSSRTPTGRPWQLKMRDGDSDSSDGDDDPEGDNELSEYTLIDSISNSKWPLKQIDWYLGSGICVYSIFEALEKMPTLEKIRLNVGNLTIWDNDTFLKLPQLKQFELEFDYPEFDEGVNLRFFFNLQFLLHAKKLKSLKWKCDMENSQWERVRTDVKDGDQVGEMIEFQGGMCDIEGSNIWRVFPWLDVISLELVMRKHWLEKNSLSGNKTISRVYRRHEMNFCKQSKD